MSRCFSYPPTGCALSRASKDPLIGSIKFQERVKSKKRKEGPMEPDKDRSKEQKKKKCEKKEKRKEKEDKTHQRIVQPHFIEKPFFDTKAELNSKGSKAEPVQLDRSTVTEEHGNPTYLLAPSTSANSTDNNTKKREMCSSPVEVTRGHGKIIRIRLLLKNPNLELQPCSTSERTDAAPKNENTFCSSSGRNDGLDETVGTLKPFMIDNVVTPMQRVELQYTKLMDSLVLLPQLVDDEDLDWLLKGKSRKSSAEEKQASWNNALTGSVSWGLWPRAQYLQEVDVYALPFTVPF